MVEKISCAVCDIGSNSVRMNILELSENTNKIIDRFRSMLGLAGYIVDNKLTNDGRGKLHTILREYLIKANSIPVDYFIVFGTEALRKIDNSKEIIDYIRKNLGLEIKIISGLDEAKYDNYAVLEEFARKLSYPFYVLDMGGGSVEINLNTQSDVFYSSIPLGSLVLSKMFAQDPMNIDKIDFKNLERHVISILDENNIEKHESKDIYVIGGTARNAGKIIIEEKGEKFKNSETKIITIDEFDNLTYMLSHDNGFLNDIVKKYCNDRKPSIMCGIYALNIILKYYGVENIIICNGGVREGYISQFKEQILNKA